MNGQPYWEIIHGARDLLKLAAALPARYPFLLESSARGTAQGRYDILFAFPQGELLQMVSGEVTYAGQTLVSADFLRAFDDEFARVRVESADANMLPFQGGWFIFLGYDYVASIETRLCLPMAETGLPLAYACRIPAAILRDHQLDQLILLAEPGFKECVAQMREDLQTIDSDVEAVDLSYTPVMEENPDTFLEGVQRIKRYIREGDVFQVNLSRQWNGQLQDDSADSSLYRRLRRANPAPFSGLARIGDASIISSSPERLIAVRKGEIVTRPIAGTRRRGQHAGEDLNLQQELLAHPKERSEHIMLIDLARNDLGRVCRPGTVRVDELMGLESYAHVHHIVSNIRGDLRARITPGDVIRAVFPGGTITGCPKVRCMEIIAELERAPRGAYTGSMGYINRDGSLDLNILIRTLVQRGRQLAWRAGAGIVADSIAEQELEETRAKAKGLIAALH